ncbi:hypothetical protein [Bradyrhizobium sp. 21]|nr:hypothetical protein [Bradyrhizobium sp. 21]
MPSALGPTTNRSLGQTCGGGMLKGFEAVGLSADDIRPEIQF